MTSNSKSRSGIPKESKIISGIMNIIDLVKKAKLIKYGITTDDGWRLEVWKLNDS